jgi:hypothetical protein
MSELASRHDSFERSFFQNPSILKLNAGFSFGMTFLTYISIGTKSGFGC